jgi:murein DD-endopeptidase MepM/ murein hydrolase activator NlpD
MGSAPRQLIPHKPRTEPTADAGNRPGSPRVRRRVVAAFGALAAVALLVSSSPVPASAMRANAVTDQAERERAEVRRKQAELAAQLDVARANNNEVVAALATLDLQVQAQTAQITEAQRAAEDANRRAAEVQAEIAETQVEIDRMNNELRQLAVRRYVAPEETDASVRLLKASNFDEAEQRKVLASTVAGNSRETVDKLRADKDRLADLRQQAEDAKAQADARVAEAEALMNDLKPQLEAQAKVKAEWDRRVAELEASHRHLEATENDLSRVIASQNAPASASTAAPAPSSGNGRMIWPIAGTISRGFFPGHTGMDIYNVSGTPIWAALPGRVSSAGRNDGGYGNLVILDHGNGLQTYYAHLSQINVSVGQSVSQGQTIGLEGSTGRSTGPHLHFEVRVNGSPQDPMRYLPAR